MAQGLFMTKKVIDSCLIGVSADSCSAGAPWLRKWSTKFIPITPYTRVANKKLL